MAPYSYGSATSALSGVLTRMALTALRPKFVVAGDPFNEGVFFQHSRSMPTAGAEDPWTIWKGRQAITIYRAMIIYRAMTIGP